MVLAFLRAILAREFMKYYFIFLFGLLILGCSDTASVYKKEESKTTSASIDSVIISKSAIPTPEIQTINNYFRKFVKRRRFNGHITIAKNGEIVFDTTAGYSNIRKRIPLKKNAAIQLASVTKPITATVILQLIEEGKLTLNDTITKFLELPKQYKKLTIRHLLAHRSGLSQYYYYCDHKMDNKEHLIYNDTVICVINFHNPEHNFRPDQKHYYSNTNYMLLASIIEAVEGKRYAEVLKTRIFDKCGMTDSFVFDLKKSSIPDNLTLGHTQWNRVFEFDYLDGIVGDKGIFSTAQDLIKFDAFLNNDIIISDSIKQIAFTPQNNIRDNKSYGYGWRLKMDPNFGKLVYHTGWWHGNRHIYLKIPKLGYTVVIVSNAIRGSVYNINELLKAFTFPAIEHSSSKKGSKVI